MTGLRGVGYAWAAIFLAFCLVPLSLMAMHLGRMAVFRAPLQAAADAAALAAAAEVDVTTFQRAGALVFARSAGAVAQRLAAENLRGVEVEDFTVDSVARQVRVRVRASHPAGWEVRAEGSAELRAYAYED